MRGGTEVITAVFLANHSLKASKGLPGLGSPAPPRTVMSKNKPLNCNVIHHPDHGANMTPGSYHRMTSHGPLYKSLLAHFICHRDRKFRCSARESIRQRATSRRCCSLPRNFSLTRKRPPLV